MKKGVALSFVLFMALPAACAADVTITEREGKLFAEPSFVVVSNSRNPVSLSVQRPDGVSCYYNSDRITAPDNCRPMEAAVCGKELSKGSMGGVLKFVKGTTAVGPGDTGACVLLVTPPASPPSNWLAWIAATLALATAVLTGRQLFTAPRAEPIDKIYSRRVQEMLEAIQQQIVGATQAISANASPGAPRPSQPASYAPSQEHPFEARINQLLSQIDYWRRFTDDRSSEVERAYRDLSELRAACRNRSVAGVEDRFCDSAITAARAMLNQADQFLDPEHRNYSLQETLKTVIQLAGLSLIEPRRNERFNGAVHDIVGRDHAASGDYINAVSRVTRRGLAHPQGMVVAKAEVRVFD